jgi:PIN domain nuclease of toxin-antitoxin system
MSAVNWAEVLSKLGELGENPAEVSRRLEREGLVGGSIEILNLTAADAVEIAGLHVITGRRGLSLGDRACLALGLRLKLPVITADRTWVGLRLGVTVRAIR